MCKRNGGGREPLVSVLMPCYNTEKYLEEAVRSMMEQTYRNMEIICVDDCSTDSTPAILARLANEDSRIRVVRNEHNLGVTLTLNRLVSLAQGKYCARMDSDDVSLPTRIEKQVSFLEAHKEIDVLSTGAKHIDANGKDILKDHITQTEYSDVFVLMINGCGIYHPATMGRAEVFKENPYSKDFPDAEDYELWCRLLYTRGVRIANLAEPLLKYRIHASQVSTARREGQAATARKIQDMYCVADMETFNNVFHTHEKASGGDFSCASKWLSLLNRYKMTHLVYEQYREAIQHFKRTDKKALARLLLNPRCFYVFVRMALDRAKRAIPERHRQTLGRIRRKLFRR